VEKTIWSVEANLIGYALEQDQDYHLEIADANGNTMIAEIPDPAAAAGSFFLDQITAARKAFEAHFKIAKLATATEQPESIIKPMITEASAQVTIVGIGFFDFIHGQTGVAPNGIELHPVLEIQFS